MHYRMTLAIPDANNIGIAVVNAPFALTRGGASPAPFVRYYPNPTYPIAVKHILAAWGVATLVRGKTYP
jgi:hypothetical protein